MNYKSEHGFGLVHLLVAMTIVATMVIGGMQLLQVSDETQNRAAVRQIMDGIGAASQAYWQDHADDPPDPGAWPNSIGDLLSENYLSSNPLNGSNINLNANFNVQGDNSLTISLSGSYNGTSIDQQRNFDEPVDPRTATTYSGNLSAAKGGDTQTVSVSASDIRLRARDGNGWPDTRREWTIVNMGNYTDMDVVGLQWSIRTSNHPFSSNFSGQCAVNGDCANVTTGHQGRNSLVNGRNRFWFYRARDNSWGCGVNRAFDIRIDNLQTTNGNIQLILRYDYEYPNTDVYGNCTDDNGGTNNGDLDAMQVSLILASEQ